MQLDVGVKGKNFWVAPKDRDRARAWVAEGYTEALKTPDDTIVFVTPDERATIRKDQAECMGCLSHCGFSSWKDHDDYTTGRLADPRSFCIQKTLQDIAHGGPVEENLMFAGHRRIPLQAGPVLFEQLHADGEATGRPHPDGGLRNGAATGSCGD